MQFLRILKRPMRWLCLLVLPLSGCLVNTHTLRRVEMPSNVMTASADQLIGAINDRCNAIQSLASVVEFQVIEGGPKKGKETTTTTFRGYIVERKPGALRVTALLPYVETKAMDMATKGETFTLLVPIRSEAFEGPNTVSTPSQNALENIRPNVFSDSLLLGCVDPDDLVTLTSETKTVLDKKAKHLIAEPDYDLMELRRKGSQELSGCGLPGGGMSPPRSFMIASSQILASAPAEAAFMVSKATPPAQSSELWHLVQ